MNDILTPYISHYQSAGAKCSFADWYFQMKINELYPIFDNDYDYFYDLEYGYYFDEIEEYSKEIEEEFGNDWLNHTIGYE